MSMPPPIAGRARIQLSSRNAPLTFGVFVAGGYRAWGNRRAKGIIHLAVKSHMIEFCGQERFVIV